MRSDLLKSLILLGFGVTVLLLAIYRLRRYRLKERYALMLIIVGAPFLVLAFWQNAVGNIAEVLGIQYTTFSLLCVTAFLFVMIFELLTIVSVQEQKINTLSQMVGLLMEKRPVEQDEPEPAETNADRRR
jgi:hypothetical protein